MATFAAVAGVKLPSNDRKGKPIIFDSYDMSPVLFRHRQVGAYELVLFHGERGDAPAPRVSATTRRRSTCAVMMALDWRLAVDTN